ncbi:MAG TPA: ATP-dependent helicase HrpB, partial [Gammaproteobacteria bacterium]|nr:ATP-dependent helicase HrpB [Gammaproteobacteria bacterium]
MQNLPVNEVLPEITATLNAHNRVVLQAPPGAGKTTVVPLALLDSPWLAERQIILLEPRRLAARNAAARMAYLLGEKTGETVGYQIRQDSCQSDKTRILVVTEGILTRKLQADPELAGTALVIFDEFHERSLQADLSLALCLQSQQVLREDLKILVMSATLNTRAIAGLLSDDTENTVPVIESEGRSYPVDIHYLDKTAARQGGTQGSASRELQNRLLQQVKTVIARHNGNTLVFLPGAREIRQLESAIAQYLKAEGINNILLAPLYGNLDKKQQDAAIKKPPAGQRKIVLATNIAETSLTIDGIDCVIDSGLERVLQYSPASGMDRLQTRFISQDSATQRAGRAGRLSAGHCYRLWPEQQRLAEHASPEILHTDLAPLMLELANWGVKQPDELRWLDLPPAAASEEAQTLLAQLGAIDNDKNITTHGRQILQLGTHPRLAHMMLRAIGLDQAWHACLLAALLSEKDIFSSRAEKTIDIEDRLRVLQDFDPRKTDALVDSGQCRQVLQTAGEYLKRLPKAKTASRHIDRHIDINLSGVLLAFAYPERLAQQRKNSPSRFLLSNGKGAEIPAFLQKHEYDYLAIANLDESRGDARIYLGAQISETQIEEYFADNIENDEVIEWNEKQQRVETRQVRRIGQIKLQEKRITPDDMTAVHQRLLQAIADIGLQCLDWREDALNLKHRVEFVRLHSKNGSRQYDLPDFSDKALLQTLDDWLAPHLTSENSIKACQRLNLKNILLAQLSWEQQQLLEKLAPERITVPSGSK